MKYRYSYFQKIISESKVQGQEKGRQVGRDKWKYSKKSGGGGGYECRGGN